MKNALVMLLMLGLLLTGISTVLAGPPQDITIDVIQSQTRYFPNGDWMHDISPFPTTFELRLTGNALHGEMTYSPEPQFVRANKFMLINRGNGRWELRMGSPHYTSPYSGLTIQEYWEGYLTLDDDFKLVDGWFKQIGYCSSPNTTDYYTYAEKGVPPKRGLWCLGWSIYTYEAP